MSLSQFAVRAPVKVSMIFLGVLLLGYISLQRLPTNLFPDLRTPKVTTTVRTRGLSPAEVERRICQPMERSLFTVRGVRDVTSIARADSAVIVTEFSWDTKLDFAFLDVKKAVADLQRDRGAEIETVNVVRYDPNAVPVVTVAITGNLATDLVDLQKLAKNSLRPRFERIEGVANIVLAGGVEEELQIRLDETLLLRYGLDVQAVTTAIEGDNTNASGGFVEDGARRYLLKAVGEFRSPEEVESVVVGRNDGVPVLLRDVAQVAMAPRDAKSLAFYDGKPAVALSFYQEAGANTVAVAKRIRDELEAVKERLPVGVETRVVNDQSLFITAALDEVKSNAIVGGVLSIVVLLFFLRDFRTTMIISIAIPISIIATFNLMFFQGLTLNLMSLGGLALGVGMLVDNAIVVLENIFRLRQSGLSPMEAAREGTRQVGAAIIASTLTTIVVFLPIVYIKGVAALLFREQALTVTYSLLASLVVALLLIPMLASRFLGAPPRNFLSNDQDVVPDNLYVRMLGWCLRHRFIVMSLGIVIFVASMAAATLIPREFMPRSASRQISLRLVSPSGTPITATSEIAQTIMASSDRYRPALEHAFVRIGEDEGAINADTADPNGPNTADFFFRLHDKDKPTTATLAAGLGTFSSIDLVERMKPTLDNLRGVKADFQVEQGSLLEMIGSAGAPLVVEISGTELDQLSALAGAIQQRLAGLNGVVNARTNILEGSPEVRIRLDRVQLGRLGFDVRTIGDTLRRRIEGQLATQLKREDGDIDLRVKVDYGSETIDTLRRITLKAPTGALVPLETVATFEVVRGPREIVRRNQERVALVLADLDQVRLSEAIVSARAALEDLRVPRGYSVKFTGEEERRQEAFSKLLFALILSLALVYMVMASIFESFLQPMLIMFTIPMAGVGVVAGLLLTGQSLNVMAYIGIVMLGGIVVNNAIVLLDCVNQVRENPRVTPYDSLLIGCSRRLRPVFMTTATTILGLLPLGLGLGEGGELRQAMAVAVIGGMVSSTILTLFIVPVVQAYLDSFLVRIRGLMARFSPDRRPDDDPPAATEGGSTAP